jgi:hypothetical protein
LLPDGHAVKGRGAGIEHVKPHILRAAGGEPELVLPEIVQYLGSSLHEPFFRRFHLPAVVRPEKIWQGINSNFLLIVIDGNACDGVPESRPLPAEISRQEKVCRKDGKF